MNISPSEMQASSTGPEIVKVESSSLLCCRQLKNPQTSWSQTPPSAHRSPVAAVLRTSKIGHWIFRYLLRGPELRQPAMSWPHLSEHETFESAAVIFCHQEATSGSSTTAAASLRSA